MFLEEWMVYTMFAIFGIGLYNSYKNGYSQGVRDQIATSADITILALKSQGLIDIVEDINGEEKIVKALPSQEEYEKIMELAKDIIRNEEKNDE